MNKLRKTIIAGALSAGLLTGCSGGEQIEQCPEAWSATEIERPYEVIGITAAIGQSAINGELRTKPTIVSAYTDYTAFGGWRNNADELGEVFCMNDKDKLALSAHGAMLIQIASDAGLEQAPSLEQYLPFSN